MPASLTRTQVRKVSKLLRAQGRKLPKAGYCIHVRDHKPSTTYPYGVGTAVEICRDRNGYFETSDGRHGLFGARTRRRR